MTFLKFLSYFYLIAFSKFPGSSVAIDPYTVTQLTEDLKSKLTAAVKAIDEHTQKIQELQSKLVEQEKRLFTLRNILSAQQQNIPWSFGNNYELCGGIINLTQYSRLTYKNPGNSTEACIWILTSNFDSITLTLTNQTLQESSLAIQPTFTTVTNKSTPVLILPESRGIPKVVNENILVLTFISRHEGEGFELEFGQRGAKIETPLNVSLDPQEGSNESTRGDDVSFEQGRHHVILRPKTGQKVHLSVKKVDTRGPDSYMSVFKFSHTSNSFQFYYRYFGNLTDDLAKDGDLIEGDVDEIILLYFHSDYSRELGVFDNFRIAYTFTLSNSTFDFHENSSLSCDSSVTLFRQRELVYKNPGIGGSNDSDGRRTCVWIVKARESSPIELTLVALNENNSTFGGNGSALVIQQQFRRRPDPTFQNLRVEDVGSKFPITVPHFLILFRSTPGQGFHISLRHQEKDFEKLANSHEVEVQRVILNVGNSSQSHPNKLSLPKDTNYPNNYFIFTPDPDKTVKILMDQVQTVDPIDYIKLFKYSKTEDKFVTHRRYSGHLKQTDLVEGDLGQPILLYFHSDRGVKTKNIEILFWGQDPTTSQPTNVTWNETDLATTQWKSNLPPNSKPISTIPIEEEELSPSIYFDPLHKMYYWVIAEGDQIYVRKSQNLLNWRSAAEKTVFVAPSSNNRVELPRLEKIGGHFYIYFQMIESPYDNWFGGRMFVIKGKTDRPDGEYDSAVRLVPEGADFFAKEAVVLKDVGERGQLHLIWSGREAEHQARPYVLYIAPLRNPMEIGGPTTVLRKPSQPWEGLRGTESGVIECPQILNGDDKVFLYFNAGEGYPSDDYCIGMMSIERNKNPIVGHNWKRGGSGNDSCVFETNEQQGIFSVGRFMFTTSPDGLESWIVYQARNSSGSGQSKTVRAQRLDVTKIQSQ